MKLKKFILPFAAALVIGLTACGGEKTKNDNKGSDKPSGTKTVLNIKQPKDKNESQADDKNTPKPKKSDNDDNYENIIPVSLEELMELSAENGCICAVAFLGYGNDIASFLKNNKEYEKFSKRFPFINEIPEENYIVRDGGQEIYCIIPAEDNCSIAINEWICDESNGYYGELGDILYRSEYAEPMIIRCNLSDAMPDTQIIMVDNSGETLEYYPSLYMQDKTLVTPWYEPGVFDFTEYAFMDFMGVWHTEFEYNSENLNLDLYMLNDHSIVLCGYTEEEPWGDTFGEWETTEGYMRSDIPGNIILYYGRLDDGNDIEWGIYEFTRSGDKLKVKHIEGKPIFSGFEGDTLEFTYEREYYI